MSIFDDPDITGIDSVYDDASETADTCINDLILRNVERVIQLQKSWSQKNVARYWNLWQKAQQSNKNHTTFPGFQKFIDIFLAIDDTSGHESDYDVLQKFLEGHASEFELNESAKEVMGRKDDDPEKKFIENHRKELMKWCPIDLDQTKQRWQQAKQNGQLEMQAYYYYLYYIAERYGHYPQSWEKMEEFPLEITPDKAVESLEKLNEEYSTTERDSRLWTLSTALGIIKDRTCPLSRVLGLIRDIEETVIE